MLSDDALHSTKSKLHTKADETNEAGVCMCMRVTSSSSLTSSPPVDDDILA
jgi:hypothetical protein